MQRLLSKGYAAFIIGGLFIVTGIVYFFGSEVWSSGQGFDPAGATMLVVVGIAMTFAFALVLRGSREL
jgi:hypothetical protein